MLEVVTAGALGCLVPIELNLQRVEHVEERRCRDGPKAEVKPRDARVLAIDKLACDRW